MRRLLATLLLLAPLALARDPFPHDYTPSPCAKGERACRSFPQSQIAQIAGLRGYDVGQEWVDAHWKELSAAMEPVCAKLATCYAAPNNDFTFCNDVIHSEALSICDRYPEGSKDREKCAFFMTAYLGGIDHNSKPVWEETQKCVARNGAPAGERERTLDYWMVPEKIGPAYPGHFIIYAVDGETRVPVKARIVVESKHAIAAEDVPGGVPTTYYRAPWKPRLERVPNAEGHRDVVPPRVRIEAPGYRTESFTMPMDVPAMTVEMSPPPSKLRRGRNTVVITARDAATGAPVEARVMGGELVLGKTNVPFELELKRGQKRPEIWVTNLYDRYSDVVVAPAER